MYIPIYIYIYIYIHIKCIHVYTHTHRSRSALLSCTALEFSKVHVCFCGLDPGNLKIRDSMDT